MKQSPVNKGNRLLGKLLFLLVLAFFHLIDFIVLNYQSNILYQLPKTNDDDDNFRLDSTRESYTMNPELGPYCLQYRLHKNISSQ